MSMSGKDTPSNNAFIEPFDLEVFLRTTNVVIVQNVQICINYYNSTRILAK